MGRRAPREAAGTPALFASLGSPDYRHLWGATACSQAAVWALVVLRAALVYELTQSNAWVGLVTMAAHLPSLVVTPFVGFLADRCERRHLLALTYGLNLGNNLLLAGLVITKQASEWPIVVLALVHGILRAVEVPTNQTLLPNLVPRERLLNAVALNQLMQQGARIFGPLCLLPIIRFVNPETAFFLAAGLYATGWWQILRIRTASYGTMVAQQGILGNLVAGLRYIYTEPLVRSLMLLTLCHCALTIAYESAFPFMARTQLGLRAAKDLFEGPAYLMIGVGAGAVLGNLALARVGDQQRRGQLFLCLGVLSGLTPILLGFTTTLHVAMLAAAAVGASTSAFMTLSQGIIQMLAPDGIRGRVMSANTWHTQGAMGGFNAVSGRTAAAVASRPTPPISSSAGTWGCRDALRLFREIQIPPDFVVDGWASSVESHSTLNFLYVPDA
jgi:MFS family permease